MMMTIFLYVFWHLYHFHEVFKYSAYFYIFYLATLSHRLIYLSWTQVFITQMFTHTLFLSVAVFQLFMCLQRAKFVFCFGFNFDEVLFTNFYFMWHFLILFNKSLTEDQRCFVMFSLEFHRFIFYILICDIFWSVIHLSLFFFKLGRHLHLFLHFHIINHRNNNLCLHQET